jgi:hypothetical protein
MIKHYKNKWLRGFFVLFFVSVLGLIFFFFSNKMSGNVEKSAPVLGKAQEVVNLNEESLAQKNILDSLNVLKLAYDVAILEKTSLSQQLELEKRNVENLIEVINASKNASSSQIRVYQKQFSALKSTLANKVVEIKNLKSQNKNLLNEIESQNVVMYKQRLENDTLVSKQKKIESTLKDASKLVLSNFKVVAIREHKSGKEFETIKAKSVDKLKVSFSILGNSIAKTGKRVFYIQVLDQKNTVLGENKLVEFGNDKALVYSFMVAVDFQGKPATVYGVLNSDEIPFRKGTYFVNFFDKQEIMGTDSVTLE